jgi:hypothetical protein
MHLNAPEPSNDRGFLLYGGSAVQTSYGHEVRIQESSAASGPHCWMFIGEGSGVTGNEPHLSLADAIEIRDRLTQFIDSVPERWTRGAAMLGEAYAEVVRRRTTGGEEKVK